MQIIKLTGLIQLLLLLAINAIQAQSNIKLKGFVFDKGDGSPVVGALIKLNNTNFRTISNAFGEYVFCDVPVGNYSMTVSSAGYEEFSEENVIISEDLTHRRDIFLNQKVYYLGRILVSERRDPVVGENVEIIFKDEIEKSRAHDISEILENVPGVFVQRSGGGSGTAGVKIRGSETKHVLVLVDGQKINFSGSGVADLNSIPLEIVERIEVYKGGSSARFGPDALGGVINIVTGRNIAANNLSANIGKVWGRWGTDNYQFTLSDFLPVNNLSVRFAYSIKQSLSDFPFSYEVQPDPGSSIYGIRINNQFQTHNYFSSGVYQLNERLRLTYSGQYYNSRKGLPGRGDRQNKYAFSDDNRRLLNTSFNYDGRNGREIKFDMGYSRFVQYFKDDSSAIKFDTKFINDIFTLRHSQRFEYSDKNVLLINTEFKRDILDHTDYLRPFMSMMKTVRDNFSVSMADEYNLKFDGFIPADNLGLNFALRYDYSKTKKDSTSFIDTVRTNKSLFWSPKLGAVLSKGDRVGYVIRASYGKSFRLPSINALFWKGDVRASGNPGLKPEKSEHSETGIKLKADYGLVSISGGATYFHSFVKDLVVWRPSGDVWKPVNNEKAQITGHEDFIRLNFFDNLMQLLYQNSITTAINKSSGHNRFNKRLVFYPHYITSYMVRLNHKFLTVSYTIRDVDKAFVLEANTRYYDSYQVADFMVGVNLKLAVDWRLLADYKLYNAGDETYLLMSNYPMPGREWKIGFKIKYGAKDTN